MAIFTFLLAHCLLLLPRLRLCLRGVSSHLPVDVTVFGPFPCNLLNVIFPSFHLLSCWHLPGRRWDSSPSYTSPEDQHRELLIPPKKKTLLGISPLRIGSVLLLEQAGREFNKKNPHYLHPLVTPTHNMSTRSETKSLPETSTEAASQENASPRNHSSRQSSKQQVRHRASVACASCRDRRIRCVVPKGESECTQCKRTGTECVIKNDDERRRYDTTVSNLPTDSRC